MLSYRWNGGVEHLQKFLLRDSCGSAFHYYDSGRIVGKVRCLFGAGSSGESCGEGRNDSVARTRDIGNLIASMDRNVDGFMALAERNHSVAAACDDEGLKLHSFYNLLAR
jgi:hypothetical protein